MADIRQAIEANTSLPLAKFTGRREVTLTHGETILQLKNADCDAFIAGFEQTYKEK